jgi:predicted dinucleotide-binding enzyme
MKIAILGGTGSIGEGFVGLKNTKYLYVPVKLKGQ